jgi:hypothetical protein
MEKSVDEIIQEWREILDKSYPDEENKYITMSRSDIEAVVKYFEDIDKDVDSWLRQIP